MIEFHVSDTDLPTIRHLALKSLYPKIRLRSLVILSRHQGIPNTSIEDMYNIIGNTIRSYLKLYTIGGLEGVEALHFRKHTGLFDSYESELRKHFTEFPPMNAVIAISAIKKITGVEVSKSQARRILKKLGLKRLKTGVTPAKADVEVQKEFIKNTLNPLLEEARSGKSTVYFVDASHFVYSAFLGYIWSFTRVFIKSYPGRQRFNVLGAIDAATHEMITICNTTYITAQTVCELLRKINDQRISGKITLILDNARYQHCELVENLAKDLKINLQFLPTYSPNLNLIERFWKFVKGKCLQNTVYETFDKFKQAIEIFIEQANENYSNELETLLSHKFQVIDISNSISINTGKKAA